ncbi:hypothetical protein D3C77_480150 [compost metagenome]
MADGFQHTLLTLQALSANGMNCRFPGICLGENIVCSRLGCQAGRIHPCLNRWRNRAGIMGSGETLGFFRSNAVFNGAQGITQYRAACLIGSLIDLLSSDQQCSRQRQAFKVEAGVSATTEDDVNILLLHSCPLQSCDVGEDIAQRVRRYPRIDPSDIAPRKRCRKDNARDHERQSACRGRTQGGGRAGSIFDFTIDQF